MPPKRRVTRSSDGQLFETPPGGGLYCFTPYDDEDNPRKEGVVLKIGLAQNYKSRLSSTHTWFPAGVHWICIINVKRTGYANSRARALAKAREETLLKTLIYCENVAKGVFERNGLRNITEAKRDREKTEWWVAHPEKAQDLFLNQILPILKREVKGYDFAYTGYFFEPKKAVDLVKARGHFMTTHLTWDLTKGATGFQVVHE